MTRSSPSFYILLLAALASVEARAAGTLHDPRESRLADVRQLTAGGENAEAYWSFDGSRLIFQSTRPPYDCDQIFMVSGGSGGSSGSAGAAGEPSLVSTGRGRTTCAYFLPGDRRVLYASTDATSDVCPAPPDRSRGYVWPVDPAYEIYVRDLDAPATAARTRLTDNRAYDAEATVCGTDGSIVFTSTRDGDLDLYRMDADGSDVKRLTSTPGYDGGAFYSADCSKLVWRASRPHGAELDDYRGLLADGLVRPSRLELWVANADGSEARQVTDLGAASFAPYFFPSGERIVFSSNYGDPKGREFDLWAVDVDGTDLERITFTPGFDGFPMFSRDGRELAFASNRNQGRPGETDVYVARWVEGEPEATSLVPRDADRFAADVAWLADDAREGRGVGTAGLAAAGEWIEARFRALGLAPAVGGGSFRQAFAVPVAVRAEPGTSVEIGGRKVPAGDFVPLAFSSRTPVEGRTIDVGYGIVAPELGRDDYANVDVRGRIAVVRRFVPAIEAFSDVEVERRHGDLRLKAFAARERGAIGMIVVDVADPRAPSQDEMPLPGLSPVDLGDAGIPAVAVRRSWAGRLRNAEVRIAVGLGVETADAFNVVGRLDPTSAPIDERAVVVGAHYDHLGRDDAHSFHPGAAAAAGGSDAADAAIHNGADDNASGVAALLDAARVLGGRRAELRRPVVFVAFAGEERGLLGSSHLVREPPAGLEPDRLAAMVNLDMVGRLRDERLTVFGTETAAEWPAIVGERCERLRLDCAQRGDGYGPSDQTSYYAAGVPVLHLFTGTHDQYHRPEDDAHLINAVGGVRVAALTAELAAEVASREAPLSLRRAAGGPPPRGDLRGFGASLGTVPDYGGPTDGRPGVLLAGVRPGGPAELAGLRRGDLVVEVSDRAVRDLNDLMFLLRAARPGQRSTVVVERAGERLRLEVVFGEPRRM